MFTSSLYLVALFASFLASTMTKKLGRKFSMLMSGCVFCRGALLNAFAINLAMLIIGWILLGVGVGVGFATQVSETPNSLIERGHLDKAKKQLQRIRGVADVQAEFNDLQLTGINVVMFYVPVLFKTIGFQSNASLASAMITGGVNV
ncbi:hypothetical protein ACSBR2_011981 [Camellia fascicularis]